MTDKKGKKFNKNNNKDNDNDYRARRIKKKVCQFCQNSELVIDYKDYDKIKKFVSDKGKILPRRVTGNCAKHQREIALNIKRARHIAILPYALD